MNYNAVLITYFVNLILGVNFGCTARFEALHGRVLAGVRTDVLTWLSAATDPLNSTKEYFIFKQKLIYATLHLQLACMNV